MAYSQSEKTRKLEEELSGIGDYKESDTVSNLYNQYSQMRDNQVEKWNGGDYEGLKKQTADKIANREAFSYDANTDPLYQQYKALYVNQGKNAMQDAIGQASAMTGGYGNSYAATVGNQTFQDYLSKLNGVIPELANSAFSRYQAEGANLESLYNMYNNMYQSQYGEYRDKVNDYNTQLANLKDDYYNQKQMDYNMWNDKYSRLYNSYVDSDTRDFRDYQQSINEQQAAAELAEKQRQYNSSLAQQQYEAKLLNEQAMIEKLGYLSKAMELLNDPYTGEGTNDENVYEYFADLVEKGELTESEAKELYTIALDKVKR